MFYTYLSKTSKMLWHTLFLYPYMSEPVGREMTKKIEDNNEYRGIDRNRLSSWKIIVAFYYLDHLLPFRRQPSFHIADVWSNKKIKSGDSWPQWTLLRDLPVKYINLPFSSVWSTNWWSDMTRLQQTVINLDLNIEN